MLTDLVSSNFYGRAVRFQVHLSVLNKVSMGQDTEAIC